MTQEVIFCLKLLANPKRISDSIGKVKIRLVQCKHLKAEQTHFPEQGRYICVFQFHVFHFCHS